MTRLARSKLLLAFSTGMLVGSLWASLVFAVLR